MRIRTIIGKRPKHLWLISRRKFNLCIFTLFAFVVFGYVMVVNVVQEIVRNFHGIGYFWIVDKNMAEPDTSFVGPYCTHRYVKRASRV